MWTPTVSPLGDRALTIQLWHADGDSPRDLIRCLEARIRTEAPSGVVGLVPAIRTLTLHYEPRMTSWDALRGYVAHVLDTLAVTPAAPTEPVLIPVCYGGAFGPDLEFVAQAHRTTPEAIIAAHTAGTYTVAMIGFLPGFPYLDGLAPALHTPRRAEPRTTVPAGSVGIGGTSTGVYPFASPGGWHLIGRTSLALFDPMRHRPSLLVAGDAVRFVAIPASEWRDRT